MKAALSYAQSQSVVEFLINVYGRDKLSQLLILFKEGSTTDDALHSIYGFDQEKLDSLWRDYLKNEFKVSAESTSSKFNMEYVKGWILHFWQKHCKNIMAAFL
jgi:hypothetical protein